LTEAGFLQAEELGKRCKNLGAEFLISSDLKRTRQTTDFILKYTSVSVEYSSLLRELRAPQEFRGVRRDSPKWLEFQQEEATNMHDPAWRKGDGETFRDFKSRVEQALDLILSKKEERILVVAHGHVLRMIAGLTIFNKALTAEGWRYMTSSLLTTNTGITVLKHDDTRWKLLTWNDHAHLG
jgi:broad specificity phosphatase PhoE